MNTNHPQNPLLAPLRSLLLAQPMGQRYSEYDLLKRMQVQGCLRAQALGDNLALFQSHFLLRNALYALQSEFQQQGLLGLIINALGVELVALSERDGKMLSEQDLPVQSKLAAYYGDWQHFNEASEDSVEGLLNDFWQRYVSEGWQHSDEDKQRALALMGMSEDYSQAELKQQYRRLMMRHHPDRGGSAEQVQQVCWAYELLTLRL